MSVNQANAQGSPAPSPIQQRRGAADALNPRRRPGEQIIQLILFLAGILSIFTTIGIVVVLANESITFFTRQQWENTNKLLSDEIDALQTTFQVTGARALAQGEVIRIRQEVMGVLGYEDNIVTNVSIGSGAGLRRFCDGESQIAAASRAITQAEVQACAANGLTPIEFRVGTDALAVVVNPQNDFLIDVTLDELNQIFTTAEQWSDVRPEWPDSPIYRAIPGEDSGTLDFFVEAVAGDDHAAVVNAANVTSEDDNQLSRIIRENPDAIGFFGYAYYLAFTNEMNILAVDGVAANAETVEDGTYPLARPLFIYSDAAIMNAETEVASFIDYYLTHVNEEIAAVGYFPASEAELDEGRIAWLEAMNLPVPSAEELSAGVQLLPNIDLSQENGSFTIAGSSTVHPLSRAIIRRFTEDGFLPRVVVERAQQDTEAVAHPAGATIERGKRVTLLEFFTGTVWIPPIGEFGVLPLVNATLMVTFIAMLVALPLGMGAAIYMSEYASPRVRAVLKPFLEVLAGIPTVVYGYFALTFVTPILRSIFGVDVVSIYNTASAGMVVGILITPLVASMAEDALHAVPNSLREASVGLGATKLETTLKVVVPAAISGIMAAVIVATSRAIGETMVVAIAAGAGPNFTFNPFDSAETMTGHIARISGGDLSYDSIDYNSIFAIGLLLFLMTLTLNVIANWVIRRYREAY
jgi:phosphate transport system permease protein